MNKFQKVNKTFSSIFIRNMSRILGAPSLTTSAAKADESFLKEIQKCRQQKASNIKEFGFNTKRARLLSKNDEIANKRRGVVYWMSRDQRVEDNWALLLAQDLALKHNFPLYVIFCLVIDFLNAPLRHFKFMLDGLKEVQNDLTSLNINFVLLRGNHTTEIPAFVKNFNIACLVCDFSPLRIHREWVTGVKEKIPADVPFIQVDAHSVVPLWIASQEEETRAYLFRPKITNKLDEFFTEFPPLIRHPHKSDHPASIDWKSVLESLKVDKNVDAVDWIAPGYRSAVNTLDTFIKFRLQKHVEFRNNPTENGNSNLSPFFHFGHISVQRAALEVKKRKNPTNAASVDMFLEQSIVRQQLSDNFCFYNNNYDNMKGIPKWATKTLNDHRADKREYLYTRQQFDDATTHDHLWNAAQVQMKIEGKMHGFLRMYWAKKILEWSPTPEEALATAIYLNDRYNIDGRDPNGYVGCLWSVCGVHDREFGERSVYGKIRYMSYHACKGKFDVQGFIRKYSNPLMIKKLAT